MSRLQEFIIFLLNNPGPVERWPKEFPQRVRADAEANGLAKPDGPRSYHLTDVGIFYGHRWRTVSRTRRWH